MQLHQLKRSSPNKSRKRVGRGGRRGKTSGRGHKGQKARAGGSPRPEARDTIKRLPKLRGHGKNRSSAVHSGRVKPTVVNCSILEKHFEAGDTVSPETLSGKQLIRKRGRRLPQVKILSQGALTKKLVFSGVIFSKSAQEKIEKVGGTLE